MGCRLLARHLRRVLGGLLLTLCLLNFAPAQAKALEGVHASAWSPDGKKISFTYVHENRPSIYMINMMDVMAADGVTDPVRLAADAYTSVWSPDSKTIAFTWGAGIYVVPVDGSGAKRYVTDGYMPSWSPDGAQIIFFKLPGVLHSINVDGSRLAPITDLKTPEIWQFVLSPDGKRLALVTIGEAPDTSAIYVLDRDGTNMRKLDDAPPGTHLSWSPDSKQLVAVSMCGGAPYVCVINADGMGHRRLADGEAPEWSPDGKQIAYMLLGQMWITAVDGSNKRLVSKQMNSTAAWSPDSKHILFRKMFAIKPNEPIFMSELYMIGADGSNLRKLPISVERLKVMR
jgi:Tol biopolymer transport system component